MQLDLAGEDQEIAGIDRSDYGVVGECEAPDGGIGHARSTHMDDMGSDNSELGDALDEPRRQILIEENLQALSARTNRSGFFGPPGGGFSRA